MTPTPEQLSEIRREAEAYAHRSDERGRLAGHVLSLLAEVERYHRLRDAVNNCGDCLPACNSYGHEEDCPRVSTARWLEDMRAEVERRGQLLDEWQALQDKITAELEAAGWRVRTVDATVSALLAENAALRDAGNKLADALAPFAVGALPSDGVEEWDALVSAAQSSLAEWRKTR